MQLNELLDLYHMGIMMFNFRQEAHCTGQRNELLQAVAELGAQLEPIQISYIGMNLCKRFVVDGNDNGVERMRRIIDLHSALLALAGNGESNCKIAMTTLLAIFSTVSEVRLPQGETDIVSEKLIANSPSPLFHLFPSAYSPPPPPSNLPPRNNHESSLTDSSRLFHGQAGGLEAAYNNGPRGGRVCAGTQLWDDYQHAQ